MVYSEPALWEAAKRAARERLGGHSARAMQLAGQLYRAAGGRYLGRKSKAQQSLTTWTRQDWTTKSGKPSRETGERYLPRRVIEQLSSAEYAATTRAKRQGTKQGKQYVKQPAAIAAKVARLKAQANPRPRKYASAAERQKALRERFPTLCVRVEQEQADFMRRIAEEQGQTLQDVHLAYIKYAQGRGNQWLIQGLKGFKPLPRFEELPKENPTMKRKPTPAQIAARERFAAMARSGAFKKKATKAKKATDDTRTVSQKLKEYAINNAILERVQSGQSVKSAYDAVLGKGAYERLAGELYGEIRKTKSNPAKKTVSQKISQLTREGYPQKQAVAIALSEERAGKVKRNPMKFYEVINTVTGENEGIVKAADYKLAFDVFARKNGYKNFAEMKQKEKLASNEYLMTEMKRRSNPRASNPIILVSDKAIATKRKRNPMKRKVIKEQRPFYYIVKVGQSYDGQFSSAHYSLEDVKKIAQQKADKYGAQAKITELH